MLNCNNVAKVVKCIILIFLLMLIWRHFLQSYNITHNESHILRSWIKKHWFFFILDGQLSFSECVMGYLEWEMKCRLPWNSKSSVWNVNCSTVDHLKQFIDLSDNLGNKTNSEIFSMTNCYRECESYSFQVTQKSDQINNNG